MRELENYKNFLVLSSQFAKPRLRLNARRSEEKRSTACSDFSTAGGSGKSSGSTRRQSRTLMCESDSSIRYFSGCRRSWMTRTRPSMVLSGIWEEPTTSPTRWRSVGRFARPNRQESGLIANWVRLAPWRFGLKSRNP